MKLTKQWYIERGEMDARMVNGFTDADARARHELYQNGTSWQARAYMSGYTGKAAPLFEPGTFAVEADVTQKFDADTLNELIEVSAHNKAKTDESALVARLRSEITVMRSALNQAHTMCVEALPKFNWGASFLDANAIKLLNEVPLEIVKALSYVGVNEPVQVESKFHDFAIVPDLDIDKFMRERHRVEPTANGRRERRIVANLIAHMDREGWNVQGVHDSDDFVEARTMKDAMELIFDLDDAGLYFQSKADPDREHRVLLILGNDMDIISDWNYAQGDADGFNAAMERFVDTVHRYA